MIENCGLDTCENPDYGMNVGCKGCPFEKCKKMETIVVNRHHKPYSVYIGRGTKFGNKYQIGLDGTREDVIAKHKKDFYEDRELQEAVWNELRGDIIGCSCKPLACHGDTYIEYIRNREAKNETG
ncbi:hypothetical protein LCGC14_0574200 [marine sediment metagenome]|uniref:DUF4326 domain-containing protein n=1 Tax=marine sediment metagenome TaxID=412755 RepID=A0A0F9RIJ0_9ZZZZ